jgi:beta-galactosidase
MVQTWWNTGTGALFTMDRKPIGEDYWDTTGNPTVFYVDSQKEAKELDEISKKLVNVKKHNRVAVLFSHDSKHALDFMPYTNGNYLTALQNQRQ